MLKISFALGFLFISSSIISSDLRTKVEEHASEFSCFRAYPEKYQEQWKQAFVAYTLHELKQGKTLEQTLSVHQVKEEDEWHGMRLQNFEGRWNDEPIMPYFNRSTSGGFDEQRKLIESDWQEVLAQKK